ncbi:MAG: transposase [Bacillota bacterium]|nr:transposase [Bacillota bacterium]
MKTAKDLLDFMEEVAGQYQDAEKIIIVWDNLNTHLDGPLKRWTEFNQKHGNKFEFHYTPIHASWVNQVEIFFSILQKRCLKHGSFC